MLSLDLLALEAVLARRLASQMLAFLSILITFFNLGCLASVVEVKTRVHSQLCTPVRPPAGLYNLKIHWYFGHQGVPLNTLHPSPS